MAYGESNGHVTDDITWPWKVKLVTPVHLEHNIWKTAGVVYCEAVRSAILATAWLHVCISIKLHGPNMVATAVLRFES